MIKHLIFAYMIDITAFQDKAQKSLESNKKLVKSLKKKAKHGLDDLFEHHHDAVFEELDCLTCANCCKTTSPIFYRPDIERISKQLKLKPSIFIETYLTLDEENDYVLQSTPCPFLGYDNKCIIYANRPKACREYPHTNRKRIYQILNLTLKNSLVCPATLKILERIKNELP